MAKNTSGYRIEIYRKYTQSAAILLMFLIGAPLGAIIKKGGLGIPLLIAILFFIIYYVVSIMGEKYSRELLMPVSLGMWLATLVLLPVGLFLPLPGPPRFRPARRGLAQAARLPALAPARL